MNDNNSDIADEEIAQLQALCDAATAEPWKAWIEGRDHVAGSSIIQTPAADIELHGASNADYDFIASARHYLPLLLAEVRRRRSEGGMRA